MFKFLWAFLLLAGCVHTPQNTQVDIITKVNQQILASEYRLTQSIVTACPADLVAACPPNPVAVCPPNPPVAIEHKPEISNCTGAVEVSQNSKRMVGEIERIYFPIEKMSHRARIDTGAETSSINAYNLKEFERDGKKWFKFQISDTQDSKQFEYQLKKYIRVLQQSIKKAERRPVVEIIIELDGEKYPTEFTLADRNHLNYKVLLGRSLLEGNFIVDVSKKHLTATGTE